jgi:hypothetical protein
MHACMHTGIHTYIRIYIHAYIHTYPLTFIHTYKYTYILLIYLEVSNTSKWGLKLLVSEALSYILYNIPRGLQYLKVKGVAILKHFDMKIYLVHVLERIIVSHSKLSILLRVSRRGSAHCMRRTSGHATGRGRACIPAAHGRRCRHSLLVYGLR